MLDQNSVHKPVWLDDQSCDIAEFERHIAQETRADHYPNAVEIASNIPIYDGDAMRRAMGDETRARAVMAEWNRAFENGPGIIAIRNGFDDPALLDAVTDALGAIIAEEEAGAAGKGDHFASAGANSRIWNAHEKLALKAPELFVRYNANELVRRVSEAWLGSGYQITTQVNVVRPGGKSQTVHRDYHMGFQDVETLKGYPASQHMLSASLTLQGAVAHSDMPLNSGPTKLLPYSQSYLPGYLAVLLPHFREMFEARYVQLPLKKGDMLFFNPATFHAAGENHSSDIQRFANLMQIGSAYGRSIEIVDRSRISLAIYSDLMQFLETGALTPREADNVVAAAAEGYPFPANLDIDSPLSGMAPPSQQHILRQALAENWDLARLEREISEQNSRKRSH
ncbi:phytanoyl-CoA dioxygenase family protein [Paracoccus sp. Z330]|uniref:Phytanoyl-CoA dioxygenase family protein n=1 Tax=Paracoccus onchidii TaxID=3017813 RepID=A0ABT4ZDN2_9RHOB|nr:phytanoyl-CoA dioxygenase family protein [Paracoccus onchidii]MDB6177387.1 phytanoyl-CoA dioxygenase family protein [Paracoccus onchidii]